MILSDFAYKTGQIAVLIDPEKTNSEEKLNQLIQKAIFAKIDYFFVGGSTVKRSEIEFVVSYLKKNCIIPVVIFPGANHQISADADALLYLSLVSGRNPDYLISHHVNNASEVFDLGIEIIPTAYILVDGGTKSSVAYVSQTTPIPRNQQSIAMNTALAAYLQGKKVIYFDAGSGAIESVPIEFIKSIKNKIQVPIIVGGGIKNQSQIKSYSNAGANIIVIGNKIEDDIDFLLDIQALKNNEF